ncbi:MAG: TetR/AcrR family transcriptional regulator [Nocardioidaceae bacterium]
MKNVSESTDTAKSALSPEQILNVAVTIADREGLAAVSMRRLGRELSVTPMALYWHFEDKDRLVDAMAERVVAHGQFDDTPSDHWGQRLRSVLTGLVALLHEHPWMGRPVIERLVPLPNYLAALEIILDSTRQAGLGPQEGAVLAQQAVQAVVALAEHEPETQTDSTALTAQYVAQYDYLASLPNEQYPNIRAAASPLTGPQDLEDYYRLGIDMVVGGIAAIADTSPTAPRHGR